MTDIPEDVMEAAREAVASQWETYPNEFILNMAKELRAGKRNCLSVEIASRAILADRAAQAERMARLEDAKEKAAEKIECVLADLDSAIEVAFNRGAVEWTRLNYPRHYERLSARASQEGSEPS